ncbi:MAG: hypothetical protein ACC658_10555, partial [Acidimicrobiia bacterium]
RVLSNVAGAFSVTGLRTGPVLLIDDVVDSSLSDKHLAEVMLTEADHVMMTRRLEHFETGFA